MGKSNKYFKIYYLLEVRHLNDYKDEKNTPTFNKSLDSSLGTHEPKMTRFILFVNCVMLSNDI